MTTIRQALTWKLLVAVAVPVVAADVASYLLICDELVEQFDATLLERAATIGAAIRRTSDGMVVELPTRLVEEFEPATEQASSGSNNQDGHEDHDDHDEAYFQIRQKSGGTLARSASLGSRDLPSPPASDEESTGWNVVLPNGASGRAVALRVRPRPDPAGSPSESVTLVLAVARADLDRTLGAVAMWLGGCGALLLVATVFIVPHVVGRAFVPLDQLADQADRIDASTLGTRFPAAELPGELSSIAARLNDLLARLEASFERERQFSDALAHELRTPLAELRSAAELSLKWPDARTVDTDRDVLAIAAHMEGIATRLLQLLRSDDGRLTIAREPIDLRALLEAIWLPLAETANVRSLRATWDMAIGTPASSDPVLLRAILTNLLQNAVEYSPAGGEILIRASSTLNALEVSVTNEAHQVTSADVERFFDRFWRGDAARSGGEHAGLGLALARAFASALACSLTATLRNGRVTLTLAASATPSSRTPIV